MSGDERLLRIKEMAKKYNVQKEFEKNQESNERWVLKSTPFIVCCIFLERYCTAGVLAILPLFLHIKLGLGHNEATSIFHIFEFFTLLFTIFGTIIADTWIGIYSAVIVTSVIYSIGLGIISMIDPFNIPYYGVFVTIGLIIIIVGSGSLKNNLNAFGGGQHKLPEQKKQLETYFTVQYFGVKCGSFLARVIFPMIRADVKCFGNNDCYSLSFGIPAAIMLFSTVIFLSGASQYSKLKPNGNMLVKVTKCIKFALSEKSKHPEGIKEHWLDYAEDKFGKKLVMETRMALKVCLMSLPVPIFWSCLMQQRSRWIFQATKLNGDLGFYTIKPDQMIVINSLMAILMIPILDKFVYPLLKKVGIHTMLQRLIFGGFLILIAFSLAIVLEIQIQHNYLSILWQIPQFFVIGLAEMFTYLSHLNFAYKEAPPSMKPVMMSLLYLSMAGGDLIVAIISSISAFPSQSYEFLFFVCLMSVNLITFIFIARDYTQVDHEGLLALDKEEKDNVDKA